MATLADSFLADFDSSGEEESEVEETKVHCTLFSQFAFATIEILSFVVVKLRKR
jgi:hypothetical protein